MRIIKLVPYKPFAVWQEVNQAGEMGCRITMPGKASAWYSCKDFSEIVFKGFRQMIYVTLN